MTIQKQSGGPLPYQLVIFDLDGTLVNSLKDLANGVNWALHKYGYPTHAEEAYRHMVGDGVQALIRRALPPDAQTSEIFRLVSEENHRWYEAHFADHTRPYDGILSLLDRLEESGVKMAVASNKPDSFTQRVVQSLLPAKKFSVIQGQRNGIPKKPDPAIAISIMEQMKIPADRTLFVGDSNVDVQTAHNAGLSCAGCLWGFRGREELKAAGADWIIDHPLDLLNCFANTDAGGGSHAK